MRSFPEVVHLEEETTAGEEGGVEEGFRLLSQLLGREGGREGRVSGGFGLLSQLLGKREGGGGRGKKGGRATLTRRRASSALVLSREA